MFSVIAGIIGILAPVLAAGKKVATSIKEHITWKQMARAAKKTAMDLVSDNYIPSLVLGIGRGGAIYGSLISSCVGRSPVVVIDRVYTKHLDNERRSDSMLFRPKIPSYYLTKVLLVAGDANTGNTMMCYQQYLNKLGAKEIKKAVFLKTDVCKEVIHYVGRPTSKYDKIKDKLPWRKLVPSYRHEPIEPRDIIRFGKENDRIVVYLVRHAETEAGNEVIVGRTDSDLTVTGVKQATQLYDTFVGIWITAVYTSPAGRAVKTAQIVCSSLLEDYLEDPDLMELDYGEWESKSRSEIRQSDLYKRWNEDPINNLPQGGEDPKYALKRIQRFLARIKKTYQLGDAIIAVSHRSLIRLIVSDLIDGKIDDYRSYDVSNCDIIKLVYHESKWKVDVDTFKLNKAIH
ncbi:MAG TPA: hypothetical protein GX398_06960 [Candidatus Cloacimonetes bacterium]|nr:hypothetical protein [Candidatus Cloacimonadota bacterium]